MELIIEEISRGNKLIGRHKFNQTKIHVGRGYNNDVILTDPHICADHLAISEENGQWYVQDLNSINGSFLDHNIAITERHAINSGDIISIGKSQLRFLLPDHPVAETIEFSIFESIVDFTRKPSVIILNLIFFLSMCALSFYLNAPSEIVMSKLVMSAVGLTLAFALLPAIYTLISHLTKHEARFLAHIGTSFIIFNVFWLTDYAETIFTFNLSSQWNGLGLSTLVSAVILFALFWFNFFIGFHQSARRRMIFAAGFTATVLATTSLITMSNTPDFRANPRYDATLLSPMFLFAPPSSVNDFVEDADKLFKRVDKKKTISD